MKALAACQSLPTGIVEWNQSSRRSEAALSGFDFGPAVAMVAGGVALICGYEPRCCPTAIMCRFARASISGSVTAERSAFSVAMTRPEMSG
jgi:hypothetical protein